jgi:hypothetical protein
LDPDSEVIDNVLAAGLCSHSNSTTPVNELPDALKESTATLSQLPDSTTRVNENQLQEVTLKTPSLVTDTGLSFTRRKSSPIPGKQNLSAKSPGPDVRRKSSWTDLLFRGRSRSRSPADGHSADANYSGSDAKSEKKKKKGVFSFLKKKNPDRETSVQQHGHESALQDVSLQQSANKRPQSLQTPVVNSLTESKGSPDDRRIAWQTLRLPRLSITEASVDGTITDPMQQLSPGRDSDLDDLQALDTPTPTLSAGSPLDRKLAWDAINEYMHQTEGDDVSRGKQNPNAAEVCLRSPPKRKLKRRTDTVDSEISECQSLPEILPSASRLRHSLNAGDRQQHPARHTNDQIDEDVMTDEDNSSTTSSTHGQGTDKRKSFMGKIVVVADDEVATLLSRADSNDADEHSICDSSPPRSLEVAEGQMLPPPPPDQMQSSVQMLTKKERQDVMLIPVDRPRSTTPVAVAPLEEYLRRASLSPEKAAADRIRLSLPGDQFSAGARGKEARKQSNPQIWMDFCGKAVSSPKVKKTYNWSEMTDDAGGTTPLLNPHNVLQVIAPVSPNDAFTPSDTPLTPVTPLEDHQWHSFNDSFDPADYLLSHSLPLPTECNKCMCKLKRRGDFSCVSPGSSTDDSPLLENRADPTAENRVLLPPKSVPSTADALPTVSRAHRADEDAECEDEPLMSPNGCECDCHSSRRFSITRRDGDKPIPAADLPHTDSILSASSDISSASSRLVDSSSS